MPPSSDPSPTRPRILKLAPEHAAPELRAQVAAALSRGQLVAIPTETIYGLAARADDAAALERLRQAKGRPTEMAFTWTVASSRALKAFKILAPLAERLAHTYWPGPLTLVLEGVPKGLELVARNGSTGVRMPAHGATREILASLDFPVVMTSANRHGSAPITEASALGEALGSQIELILDGGPSPLSEGSAVLRVAPGHFELLRPGLMDLEHLREVAGLRLGFVCTGNTCRSPMAEGFARSLLEERLQTRELQRFGFEVSSMGVYAALGSRASIHAVQVLAERGIDISGHRSRSLPMGELDRFDALYCLTQAHRQALLEALPPGKGDAVCLLDPRGRDVSDPFGGNLGAYSAALELIQEAIEARATEWC